MNTEEGRGFTKVNTFDKLKFEDIYLLDIEGIEKYYNTSIDSCTIVYEKNKREKVYVASTWVYLDFIFNYDVEHRLLSEDLGDLVISIKNNLNNKEELKKLYETNKEKFK